MPIVENKVFAGLQYLMTSKGVILYIYGTGDHFQKIALSLRR